MLRLDMCVEGGIAQVRFAAGTNVVSAIFILPGPASSFLLRVLLAMLIVSAVVARHWSNL